MAISLSNPHMRATVASVVWSETDAQLVAVLAGAVDRVVINALVAEMQKNTSSALRLVGDAEADLAGARRGCLTLSTSLEHANARGTALLLQHWRAGDPRQLEQPGKAKKNGREPDEYFYVVALYGDDLAALFLERLQIVLPWPLKREWAQPLLDLGLEHHLVQPLSVAHAAEARPILEQYLGPRWENGTLPPGVEGMTFQSGVRVLCSQQWSTVLSDALQSGRLQMSKR
jgi:hypothetical protein